MGQYRSYKEMSLERQIADIEQALVAYKTTQSYGVNQIQSRSCTLPDSLSSTAVQVFSRTQHWVLEKITFSGVNKNKLARGALTWSPSSEIVSWYINEASDPKEIYEMKWYILIQGLQSFSVNVQAYMNMDGRLSHEKLF